MIACTAKLTNEIADDLDVLCPRLVTAKLIGKNQLRDYTNEHNSALNRAAKLVSAITDRVNLDTENFDTFVRVLEEDEINRYKVIVKDLKQGNLLKI